MNRNPIFPNWQLPRRQPFCARRGIALLRALRMRLAEQTQERCVQTQLEFGQFVTSRRAALRRMHSASCRMRQASSLCSPVLAIANPKSKIEIGIARVAEL